MYFVDLVAVKLFLC